MTTVGICVQCAFARSITSAKGSTFWLCTKSESDPRFRKYPPLPVLRCSGYQEKKPGSPKNE
jgi:hypothetical protein